jgi:hypothetical protein
MSDPRGHGFMRGRGKWHARSPHHQRQIAADNHPLWNGWEVAGRDENDLTVYHMPGFEVEMKRDTKHFAWMLHFFAFDYWITFEGYNIPEISEIARSGQYELVEAP